MIVSISQPAYLPWLGYFDKIDKSDHHIVLDDVQIETNTKSSFTNRNKIKTNSGPIWLSVPIKTKNSSNIIKDVLIDNSSNWKRKHFNSLQINYNKSKYFKNHESWIKDLYSREWSHLSELNNYITKYLIDSLSISTSFSLSSKMKAAGSKSDYILNLCKEMNATVYLSGPFGKDYLHKEEFKNNNIEIKYHEYVHPNYVQLGSNSESYLSILDLIFNHGSGSLKILKNE